MATRGVGGRAAGSPTVSDVASGSGCEADAGLESGRSPASGTLKRMQTGDMTGTDTDRAQALGALRASLVDCSQCGLREGRTQVVFGAGDPEAALMFVGEGPGFHEDRQGEPFVGQAGKLLNELLARIGLSRADVYIANVIKCRPPENRDPTPEEGAVCSPHLMQQIGIIRPRVVCTLGRFATKLLAGTELSMTAVHGKAKMVTLAGVDTIVFPVFHPAAALYTPANRQILETDFAKLRPLLERGPAAMGPEVEKAAGSMAAPTKGEAPTQSTGRDAPVETAEPEAPGEVPADRLGPSARRTEQLPLW